jgi:cyclopropane fatty-acyl-phospholipid synthase-like methyltransferase
VNAVEAALFAQFADALELESGMRLLELGSGSGRLAIEIKRRNDSVHSASR